MNWNPSHDCNSHESGILDGGNPARPPPFYLLELEKFSGNLEDYPVFKQGLLLCLEKERFRDERDKALFIFKHLKGVARGTSCSPHEASLVRILQGCAHTVRVDLWERTGHRSPNDPKNL